MLLRTKRRYAVLDDFFLVLSNRQRVRILQALSSEGPMNVGQISDELGIQQSAVSHCMQRLRACHFVAVQQRGKERVYTINEDTVRPLFDLIDEHVRKYCAKECRHWE
ncbi:MAG TPA: metalloregulator ArsR/SmtB family transcription factor [Candidatus Saccharimonadales bacterium]